jgi:glycosyltransferase involved in cell wall biosynthesis
MRILILSCRYPADLQRDVQGTFRRFTLFLDALKAIATLDLLFFVPPHVEVDYSPEAVAAKQQELSAHWNAPINLFLCPQRAVPENEPRWQRQLRPVVNFREQNTFYPTSTAKQVHALEACLDRQPDTIFCHRLESMTPLLQTSHPLPPIFFDLDDVEHISFARQIGQPPTRLVTKLYYLQIPALWWGERQSMRRATRTFVCSQLDQTYLTNRWGLDGIVTVPNAVSIPPIQSLCPDPTLMLLGGYYYYPNLNAANYLIEHIWPLVRQARPDARLIIAGTQPEKIRTYSTGAPGVEFTGFVDDLDALYQGSRIVCCPIRSGGGTRVKMIEAAAYGKPIVATRIGAEGLGLVDGQDYLQRDSAQDFAAACLALLNNDALCQRLGTAARQATIQQHDRQNILRLIQHHVTSALSLTPQLS